MKRKLSGGRRQRIPPRMIRDGAAVLGLLLALVAIADLPAGDRRVVLVDTRSIQSVTPPFTYENDQRRFMNLVVMPICPGDRAVPAIGRRCTATDGGARVTVREDLVAGEDGKAVAAVDLAVGCKEVESFLKGYRCARAGDTLTIRAAETLPIRKPKPELPAVPPPPLLVPWLQVQPPALVAQPGEPKPVGTGPFYVDLLWCREEREKVQCSSTADSPPLQFGALDDWLEEILVLRRRDGSRVATTEIVVLGLRREPEGGNEPSMPITLAPALAEALDAGAVHGVFDLQADLKADLEKASEGRQGDWRLREPHQDRVLVAALHPPGSKQAEAHLPSRCRPRLVNALAKIRQDTTFLRQVGARPAGQLLPEPFGPLHTWQNSVDEAAPLSPDPRSCEIDLVTNTAWKHVAGQIVDRLEELDSGLKVEVSPLPPEQEGARREGGDYGISLMSLVYLPRPEAYYLWDNLHGTGWATPEHLDEAAELAAKEADLAAKKAELGVEEAEEKTNEIYAEIDALHRKLDAYLIPMGAPTRVVATSDRLLGLDPGAWTLDPDRLRLAPSPLRSFVRSVLLAASVALLALAVTTHISRQAAARRTRVELSLRMLRHDMLAPLATIKAYAERVLRREPKIGEALLSEAEAALAVAEDARFVLQEGKLEAEGSAPTTKFREQVIEPILDNLRRRASYEAAEQPTIKLELPDKVPPVAVPPEVAKFVVRTLVENAWRHRGDWPLVLGLAGTVAGRSFHLQVEDRGPGMTPDDAAQLFAPGYRSAAARRAFAQGSGMGLHLARSFLRLHGGEIELRQAADPTIFTVRFPLASTGRGKPDELPEKETP